MATQLTPAFCSAATTVTTGRGRLHSASFGSLAVYREVEFKTGSMSGTVLFKLPVPANSANGFDLVDSGVVFVSGIYVSAGPSVSGVVFYD